METPPVQKKKGIGALGWLGIGCGSIVGLVILGAVIVSLFFGDKIKEFANEAQKNPTRLAATTMLKFGGDKFEMAASDDEHKRYTVREKATGKLTTFYLSAKKGTPEQVDGDFSAIPADDVAAPSEAAPAPAPAPAEKN